MSNGAAVAKVAIDTAQFVAPELAIVHTPSSQLPVEIDTEAPLPDEIKAWVYEHGSQLLRALTNECANANRRCREMKLELEEVKRSRDQTIKDLRRRLGDARGLADA